MSWAAVSGPPEPGPAAAPDGAASPPPDGATAAGIGARRRRLVAAAAALVAALALLSRLRDDAPAPDLPPEGFVVFADTEGWYRQTPAEVAVRTPIDFALASLPASLPLALGPWDGEDRPADPAVATWFRQPEVAIERTYRRADGELVWVAAFGSRGDKSFHLFEHTPDTCYPLSGWGIDALDVARIDLRGGPRPLAVNRGVATHQDDGRRMVFLFFYLWDQPGRSPDDGVLSLRIAAPVSTSPDTTMAMLADDFLPRLFDTTLAWRRF